MGVDDLSLNMQDMEDIRDQHDLHGILQASGCSNAMAANGLENFHKIHGHLIEG